jgi:hypothetical protein
MVQAAGDFPCEAGGPYMGIAHNNPNMNYYLPVYFHGTYGPLPGPSGKIALSWDFKDGTYGSGANPVHQYNTVTTYSGINFTVTAPPYQAYDTTTATIYSNNWIMTTRIFALRNWVFMFGTLHLFVQVGSASGQYDDTPPFQTVIELWQNGVKQTELDRHDFNPLAQGGNTNWYDYSFVANYPTGQYEFREKVVLPNGLNYELCDPATPWSFSIL